MRQNKTVLYRRMIDRITDFYIQMDEYNLLISSEDSSDGHHKIDAYKDMVRTIGSRINEDISILCEVFSIPNSQIMEDIGKSMEERRVETIGSIISR